MKKLLFFLPIILLSGCSYFASAPQPTCEYAGIGYNTDATFQSVDDCNTCRCKDTGEVICTDKACDENNPAQCQTDADCKQINDIDTSFCDDGQWSCIDSMCEFSCDII